MATTNFTDNSTLIEASWLDDVDTFSYGGLTSVGGTANAITATGPASMTGYSTNQMFRFVPASTNTGTTTINITPSGGAALGAKNIFAFGAACAGGEMVANVPALIYYDGTQFNIIGPATGAFPDGAAATPSIHNSGDTNTGLFFPGANIFACATDGTERWRTTASGYFKASDSGAYLDATAAYHEFRSSGALSLLQITNTHATTPAGLYMKFTAASPDNNTQTFAAFDDSTTTRCFIYSDGDLQNHDNSYGAISDARLKTNIVDANSQLADFRAYRFRNYEFISDIAAGKHHRQIGLIAQEVLEVSPGLVKKDRDGYYAMEYSVLAVKAAKAVQELVLRTDGHETDIAAIKTALAAHGITVQ